MRGRLTLGVSPASCLKCWLILAVFLAMLWVLIRLILSLMLSCSGLLYLSAGIKGPRVRAGSKDRRHPRPVLDLDPGLQDGGSDRLL